MRVAVIGLGDIAQKAYLPLLSRRADLDLVLCSRNEAVLQALGREYRITQLARSVGELDRFAPQAAFIHTATPSHEAVATALLEMGAHVYLDKPMAYELAATERLVALARARQRLLMLGFNRRHAPLYRALRNEAARPMVLMHKHRTGPAAPVREFIYDDFIHVADTLRWLAPAGDMNLAVAARVERGLLYHVSVQIQSGSFTGVGVMNRDSGCSEESLEVLGAGRKARVDNLDQAVFHAQGTAQRQGFGDWTPVLQRRGFEAIIDAFVRAAQSPVVDHALAEDAMQTHQLCERIVTAIEAQTTAG